MPKTTKTHNAINLLKTDHKKVKDLFDRFEKAEGKQQQTIAEEAIKELKVHSVIEEEIFYPAVKNALSDEMEIMDEAEEEHRVAKTLITELEKTSLETEHFEAKFMVLAENVRHHIKEEETEMFKKVKSADLDLEELGEQMMARKEELESDEDALNEASESSQVKPYQELVRA